MTVTIATQDLVGLLTDMAATASPATDGGPKAAVLLHTTRGHLGAEPGVVDLLVGTSTSGFVVGHAHELCSGQLPGPMLWSITDVRAVVGVLKPMCKIDNHAVEISPDTTEDGKPGWRVVLPAKWGDESPGAGVAPVGDVYPLAAT